MSDFLELKALLDDYEKTAEKILALKNILHDRFNYPLDRSTIFPHELLDKYLKIRALLRSEFS